MQWKQLAAAVGTLCIIGAAALWAQHSEAANYPYVPYDHPAINYPGPATENPVAKLQDQLTRGQLKLGFDAKWGYLPSVLKYLGVNTDSQMLVFSKTSFQAAKISPEMPRALYFNDNVGVGYVQNGDVMEFAALDTKQGVVFYTMQRAKNKQPEFNRANQECLNCHLIPGTAYVPGLLATSVIPRPDGSLRFAASAILVDSRTPFEQRWGGWYVTGTSGTMQHRGNAFAPNPDRPSIFDFNNTQNITRLDDRFNIGAYLAPSSDIVALMTLEHQTRIFNLLTRTAWETRIAVHDGKLDAFKNRLGYLTDEVVAYMLFADEARMSSPVKGVSSFTRTFPERGPRDHRGRSLRDFDLETRLFRYPLSYMIYNSAFDALPQPAKGEIYRKLFSVLTSKPDGRYARLCAEDREAILEIVRDTKPDLPDYWRSTEK
ncbi:MAG TPA: hypothetical protein VHW24_07015 [Bryobacteraceae bacterium]|nr:hypothetical protein [Bryobacteraceae bacterium]